MSDNIPDPQPKDDAEALDAEIGATSAEILRRDARGFVGGLARLEGEVAAHPGLLLVILDSRARARSARNVDKDDLLPGFGWRVGFAVGAADQVLERLGAPWDLTLEGRTRDEAWLIELREGLDRYAQICWCLRFGYTVAAVSLARRFSERWSFNLASSSNTWPAEGELDEDFYSRLWRQYAHRFTDRDVGADWAAMSELLHGRPITLGARSIAPDQQMQDSDRVRLHSFLVRASEVVLRQARGAIHTAAKASGTVSADDLAFLQMPVNAYPTTLPAPDFLSVFFEPHDYAFVTSRRAEVYSSWGQTYRRITHRRAAGPVALFPTDSWMAIEERWVRGRDMAEASFARERAVLGDAFQPAVLRGTIAQYRAIAEMADLASELVAVAPQAQALRAAGAALESAWVLWLQDFDESMTCMRTALESTARARAYRLKPTRAEKQDARPGTRAPHRWMDLAGWKAMSAFVRALGEFTHIRTRSRHRASRELLEAVQRGPIVGSEPYTARARALEETAFLLGHEVSELLEEHRSSLASPFREQVLFMTTDESVARLRAWLDHARTFKDYDFGDADYPAAPPEAEPAP